MGKRPPAVNAPRAPVSFRGTAREDPAMEETLLLREIQAALESSGEPASRLRAALEAIALAFGARAVTLHRVDPLAAMLHLVAARGVPESLLAVTREIPFGKGMAGLCAIRGEPVTVCNLQSDGTGAARPAARESGVAGAIVLPVPGPADGRLVGTLGIGKESEHTYSVEEIQAIAGCARALGTALASPGGG
jgi:L-methionine (R)-S-oxide reductase